MKKELSRRTFIEKSSTLAFTVIPAMGLGAFPSLNNNLNVIKPHSFLEEDPFRTYVRLMGSLETTTIYSWFSGYLWGIIPNEAPKPLVTLQGLAKSNWQKDGNQVTKESFDLGFFGDLETGEVLQEWKNPYTNKIVQPFHFMYGGGSKTTYSKEGIKSGDTLKPYKMHWMQSGDQMWMDEYGSFSFKSPLQPEEWPKASPGKQMHFGSSTTYMTTKSELFNPNNTTCNQTFFWTAVNSWEPWLHMGQREGYVMWRATGRKIFDIADIPDSMKSYVAKVQPNYFTDKIPWQGRRSTYTSYKESRKAAVKN